MRIIDKNTDFYDYIQNIYPDDSLVFDRTDSFVLTKEIMCDYISIPRYWRRNNEEIYSHVLLQVCNTFWLFLLKVTKTTEWVLPSDYTIELLSTWKNYDKPRILINLNIIQLGLSIYSIIDRDSDLYSTKTIDSFIQAINTNDYKVLRSIDSHTIYNGDKKIEKHIPLLKACGVADYIDPMDIFLSFEEYFSLEKTASERRDPIGITDVDKVESHGFDKKTSFRGKWK